MAYMGKWGHNRIFEWNQISEFGLNLSRTFPGKPWNTYIQEIYKKEAYTVSTYCDLCSFLCWKVYFIILFVLTFASFQNSQIITYLKLLKLFILFCIPYLILIYFQQWSCFLLFMRLFLRTVFQSLFSCCNTG